MAVPAARSSGWPVHRRGPPGLAVPPALGVGDEAEQVDDLGRVDRLAVGHGHRRMAAASTST